MAIKTEVLVELEGNHLIGPFEERRCWQRPYGEKLIKINSNINYNEKMLS